MNPLNFDSIKMGNEQFLFVQKQNSFNKKKKDDYKEDKKLKYDKNNINSPFNTLKSYFQK